MYLVRKIRLIVIGENKEDVNEKYKFIRDGAVCAVSGIELYDGTGWRIVLLL